MINVDVTELRENVNELKKIINEYEVIQLNIFNQLKESTVNWQDGNSIKFSDAILLEKKESDLFLESLQNLNKIYDYICRSYGEIGNKIEYYMNNKQKLFTMIDVCYSEVIGILNEFDRIDTTFYFSEQNIIFFQKQKINELKAQISSIKRSFNELFSKIENIDKNIKNQIQTLDKLKINKFNFDEE